MKKLGDLVKHVGVSKLNWWNINGLIIEILSPRWVKVAWPDGLIQKEHVGDLEILSTNEKI